MDLMTSSRDRTAIAMMIPMIIKMVMMMLMIIALTTRTMTMTLRRSVTLVVMMIGRGVRRSR